LTGVDPPDEIGGVRQSPVEGTSFAYLLEDGAAPERHTTQYFEMFGSRGLYHDGWKAVTFKPLGHMYGDGIDPDAPFEEDRWELYRVATDPSECDDVAATHPDVLERLVARWWQEAERYHVLPLDNRPLAALLAPRRPPSERTRWRFWPGSATIPETVTVNMRNRSHVVTAVVEIPTGGAEGVLIAMGTALGGWSLQVIDGRLRYVSNYLGKERYVVSAEAALEPGRRRLEMRFTTAGDFKGRAALLVDGTPVGSGDIPRVTPARYSITGGGITCGWEQGPPVGEGYRAPFPFSGRIEEVVIEIDGDAFRDPQGEFDAIMSEQ
ncbi:MAG TPA: hypothetical protein VGI06_13380, partial [Acidimicrobiales bacterium]